MDQIITELLAGAALAVVLGLIAANTPPGAARISRFATRHRLDVAPDRSGPLAVYLALTRRRRVYGALLGMLASLAWTLPQQRIAIEFVPLLAGWLLGAASAEAVAATGPRLGRAVPVPSWLRSIPWLVSAIAVGATTATLSLAGAAHGAVIAAWGAGAVIASALVVATVRHVVRRAALAAVSPDVDLAAREHAVAAVTSVGLVLGVHCLLGQFAYVHQEMFGQTAQAAETVAAAWAWGSLVLGLLIWTAAGPGGMPWMPAAASALLLVFTTGWVARGMSQDRPPYGPEVLRPSATVRLTDMAHAHADADALGVTGLSGVVDMKDVQNIVGRVDLAAPGIAPQGAYYQIVVIDRRNGRALSSLYGVDGGGWGGNLGVEAAHRYDWLAPLAPPEQPVPPLFAHTVPLADPMAVYAQAGADTTRVAFEGVVPGAGHLRLDDLQVVLLFTGPQQQLYWAVEVPVNTV